MKRPPAPTPDAMRAWLKNHRLALATPGLIVGQIDRDKAQRFQVALARHDGLDDQGNALANHSNRL